MKRTLFLIFVVVFIIIAVGIVFSLNQNVVQSSNIHPILNWSGRVVGGTVDGKYVNAEMISKYIENAADYSLYSMTGLLGKSKGLKSEIRFANGDYYIEFEKPQEIAFAIQGDWKVLPRVPIIRESHRIENEAIIKALLSQNGLANAPILIKQVVDVDIDGDGTIETFVTACNLTDKDYEEISEGTFTDANEKYSMIVMLKKAKGQEKAIVISESYKDAVEYKINYFADIDGDGKMELSVNEQNMSSAIMEAEGFSISTDKIHAVDGESLQEVLSIDSSPR